MIIEHKQLLIEQFRLGYPTSKITSSTSNGKINGISIFNIPYDGIKIVMHERIDFNFDGFDKIEFTALSTYFEPRLKYEDVKIFYNEKQLNIYLYKKFSKDSKGEFEKAMWTYEVIEYFINSIKKIVDQILGIVSK